MFYFGGAKVQVFAVQKMIKNEDDDDEMAYLALARFNSWLPNYWLHMCQSRQWW